MGCVKVAVEEEEEKEEGVGEGEELGAVEEELAGPVVGETSRKEGKEGVRKPQLNCKHLKKKDFKTSKRIKLFM